MNIKRKSFKSMDYSILFSMLFITAMGITTIGSATLAFSGGSIKMPLFQLIWLIISCLIGFCLLLVDYNIIGSYYKVLYIISNVLLASVLVFGSTRKGHKSWLGIGQFGIQPTEFAKLIIIIVIAKLLEDMDNINNIKNLSKIFLYAVIPMVLIQLQPDSGSNMVFLTIILGMLFAAGLNIKIIYTGMGALIISALALWKLNILKPYQKNRILVFLNPELDKLGAGYNAMLAKTAVGSGEMFGRGISNIGLTDGKFIPEAHTDFIFSAFSEKWGFLGGFILILLYLNIIIRGIKIAKGSKDRFGCYLVVGIVTMLTFHIFENMGMNIGIAPITGIPLPLMSYGGSSLLTTVISIALIINVGMRRQKISF